MPNSGDSPARLGNVQSPVNALDAANKQYVDKIIPSGIVVMWSGTVNNIPTGWALCDGTNGTPDLRGRFVLGAGGTYNPGDTGGSEEVTLTVGQMPEHDHPQQLTENNTPTNYIAQKASGEGVKVGRQLTASAISSSAVPGFINNTARNGNGEPHPNMPPYYALCYIMKL